MEGGGERDEGEREVGMKGQEHAEVWEGVAHRHSGPLFEILREKVFSQFFGILSKFVKTNKQTKRSGQFRLAGPGNTGLRVCVCVTPRYGRFGSPTPPPPPPPKKKSPSPLQA